MKYGVLLGLLILSLTIKAQIIYSTGECRAGFRYEFNPDIMTFAPGVAINFYDNSEGEVNEWYWDFGEGHTSNEQNPMYIFNYFPEIGDNPVNPYRIITLTILTDSCKSSVMDTINIFEVAGIHQNCTALFKYYELVRDSVSGTVIIHFDNYSEGEELSYLWQFGNGSISNEKNPEVQFSLNENEVKVCLTVTGRDSCSSEMCDLVYISPWMNKDTINVDTLEPDCIASFGYEIKDILMGPLPSRVVSFYSKSFPEATEWYWDFGDGATSTEPNPTHVYYKNMNSDSTELDSSFNTNCCRNVCLTLKTVNNCLITYCETIRVFDEIPEPEKCKAYFKYYQPDNVVTIPEVIPVQLVDVSEGDIVSRLWQFEDGTVSTEKEPVLSFDLFQAAQRVCLTVTFADSCTSSFCDMVDIKRPAIDTTVIDPACPYHIRLDGGFPIWMSSCAGWASVKVYLEDKVVEPVQVFWSTGDSTTKAENLCPLQIYSVKALMKDGCVVRSNFILNTDGSINIVSPFNWWVDGDSENLMLKTEVPTGLKVEWTMCDGSKVEADSVKLDDLNCGGNDMNYVVIDSLGNVVYTENISLKAVLTSLNRFPSETGVKIWPNPVNDKLNIGFSGTVQNELRIDIYDITGRQMVSDIYRYVSAGTQLIMDMSSLNPGIYICRITGDGQVLETRKLSKR